MGWLDIIDRLKRATGLSEKQVAALEKRGSLRVQRQVSLIGVLDAEKIALLGLDLSAKGLRAHSPTRLKRGDRLSLIKDYSSDREKHRHDIDVINDAPTARVVWIRKRRNALNFEVGFAFDIDTPEQRRAVARFVLEDCRLGIRDPREHRKAPRVHSEMRALMLTADGTTHEGLTRDVALGGALVEMKNDLLRNTTVDIKVFLPGDGPALHCKGTVVRSQRLVEKTYELAVAFGELDAAQRERLVTALSKLLAVEEE